MYSSRTWYDPYVLSSFFHETFARKNKYNNNNNNNNNNNKVIPLWGYF